MSELASFIKNFEKNPRRVNNFKFLSKDQIKIIDTDDTIIFLGEGIKQDEFYYRSIKTHQIFIVNISTESDFLKANYHISPNLNDFTISFLNNYYFTLIIYEIIGDPINEIIANGIIKENNQELQILISKKNEPLYFDSDEFKIMSFFFEILKIITEIKNRVMVNFNNLTIGNIILDQDKNLRIKDISRSTLMLNLNESLILITNTGIQNPKKIGKLENQLIFSKTEDYISFKLSGSQNLQKFLKSEIISNYDYYTFLISCFSSDNFHQAFLKHVKIREVYHQWFYPEDFETLQRFILQETFRKSLNETKNINLFIQSQNIKIKL